MYEQKAYAVFLIHYTAFHKASDRRKAKDVRGTCVTNRRYMRHKPPHIIAATLVAYDAVGRLASATSGKGTTKH